MNKTSYSKRGPIAFSALLIIAIILSLILTNLFSPKAEEAANLDQTKGTAQVSVPSSPSTTNKNDDSVVNDNNAVDDVNGVVVNDGIVVDNAQPQNDPVSSEPVPGQVVVQFSPESSEQERAAYVESLGGTVVNTIEALDTVVLSVPEEIAKEPLPASPIVQQAEQDHFISALDSVNPNDPNYASQWALSAINAPAIWAQIPENTPTVTVAVVDTGTCPAHEDLAGRIVAGWDFVENDAVPQDANGHGCFVSGLIAANMNNGIGIAGVAPNANIMPLRVLDANGNGSDSNVAAAIVYAADHGAQVINLSLGGSYPSLAMENAVNYAVAKGVSVVAAAGNSGALGALYPAKYPAAIAVGSLDSNLQHSSFSNYGPDIDIWAPGSNIMSTQLSGGYGTGSGTSFAAPYVAGAKAIDLALNRVTPLTGGNLDFSTAPDTVDDPGSVVSIAAAPTNDNFTSATYINAVSPTLPYTPTISTTDATSEAGDPVPTLAKCGAGTIYDDKDALWTYTGSWGISPAAGIEGPYAKSQHTTNSLTATASFSFTGPAKFILYYTEKSSYGQFDVYVDGTFVTNIDAAVGTAWQVQTPPMSYGVGTHTVMIKNVSTGGEYIDVDAIRIDNTGPGLHSVWYKYRTGHTGGRLHVDTSGSSYDTVLALWTGTSLGSLTEYACNNNKPSNPGTTTITSYYEEDVAADTTYFIEVMSFGAIPVGGWLHINFDYAPNPGPANDELSGATTIPSATPSNSAYSYLITQDTRLATQNNDIVNHDPQSCGANEAGDVVWGERGGASVWYKYTVPADTDLTKVPAIQIDTKGSTYDTIISVWTTDSGPAGLVPFGGSTAPASVSCNDDIGDEAGSFSTNSKLKITLSAASLGQTYYILVASRNVTATGTLASASAGDISAQYDGGGLVMHLYSPAPYGAGTYEDDHAGWSYTGDWYTYSGIGPSNGIEHYSKDADASPASAKFYFEGVGFVLKYAKNYNRGNIEVWVDGVKEGTINANSPTLSWQNTYTSKIYTATAHTVEFKHAGPSETYIDIDSIQIIGLVPRGAYTYPYDDTDTAWTYGGSWTFATGSGPSYGTRHYTTTPNDVAMFSFAGPAKFILTYTKMSTGGNFYVYVDDVYLTTLSAYNATTLWKQTYTSPPYDASGIHRVMIKHDSTSGKYVDVDAIQILGLPSLGTTIYDDRNALWAYTGTWKSYTGSGPLYNTRRYTATLNATASFSFIGPAKFALTYSKLATSGSFQIYVDGVYVTTINAYSATTRWRQTYTSGPYLSGMHTVMIKNIGPSGKYVDVDAIQLVEALDTIAPSAITDLVATSGAAPGTVGLTWTAPGNDSTSGTATLYLVRYSTAPIYASNWASATAVTATANVTPPEAFGGAESLTVTGLMPGLTYYFAVRAQDSGPNLGAMSSGATPDKVSAMATALPSAPAGSVTYDDRDANWYYAGTWTAKYPVTGPLNSSRHYTATLNNMAAFTFTGPAKFILYYAKTATSGSFRVYVDNALVTTINAYSATTLWRQTYTSPLYSSGTHTVVLKNITSGKYMDVDAIQIVSPPVASATAAVYDDRHALWTYTGTWTSYSGSGPLNNTRRYSATLNGTASFPFTVSGTPARFILTYSKTTTSGNFEIYVDGILVTTINAYGSAFRQTYTSPFYDDGTHIVTLKNVTSGKYMDVDAITISTTTDAIPPSAITNLTAISGSNAGEVTLNWTAPTDGGTGASYLVRYSTAAIDESNWNSATAITTGVPVYATPASPSMIVTGLTPGVTYYFAVRTQDTGPNLSDMSNSPSAAAQALTSYGTSATPYDDRHAGWYYAGGTWTAGSGSGPLNSTRYYTATLNATATFSFTGPAKFILTYSKMATSGSFQIFVDGTLLTTINAYNATTLWRQTYTSPLYSTGTHTVVIKNTVSGKYTDVDAIQILGPASSPNSTIYDDADASWTYTGTWGSTSGETGPYPDVPPSTGTRHTTSELNAMAEFTFTGPASFTLIYSKASDYGSFEVSVDGALITTINANNASTLYQQAYVSPIYLSGAHTVNIKNIGSKMDVDAIQVIPLYDDSNALWTYTGTWTTYSGAGPLNNTRRYTTTLNGTAAFSFTGPARFTLTYTKTSTSSNFDIYVDGVYLTTINAYNATTLWKQTYTSPPYLSGIHTVIFKNVTSGKTMDVDAIQIVGTSDTPPAPITTLAATSGGSAGTVNLNWTAVGGNNGTVGPDTTYLVRYSTAPITSSSWGSATAVADTPPPPAASGAQSMTVTGLTPSVTYYFAIRTQDTGPNLGDLSSNTDPTKLYAVAKIPAAVVGAGPHDDTAWYYNSATAWTASTGVTGPYNDTQHTTTTPNSVAAISFTGPANFNLIYTKFPTGGGFAIYVDNVLATTINTYNATTLWKQTYISRLYPSGIHTVVIKNIGASGKMMDVDAIQIVTTADTTPPSAITNLAAASGTETGTVNLSWTAPGNNGTTGTASSYLVRYSTAPITSGNWTSATAVTTDIPVPSAYGASESMTVTGLMPGTTYYFAVRAQDATPNLGSISNSPSATATAPSPVTSAGTYDDTTWDYIGTWTTSTTSGPYLSTLHSTSAPNNMAAFSFTGPARFILYYPKTATGGSLQVYVDNALLTTISTYSASTLWQQTYASPFYSTGTHTVVIKSTSTTGKVVSVDAITIAAPPSSGIYDDANSIWTYASTWKTYSGTGPLYNTRHYTSTLSATASISFTGPAKFVLYYSKTPTSGSFRVYVDGTLVTTINAYRATTLWKQTYTSPYYLSGAHTVKIMNIGPSGKYTDVDAINIVAAPDTILPSSITNLAAVSGGSTGTVDLSWTTPGDDDGTPPTGTATSYLVRYSTAAIDASNWASATAVASGIPTPKAPGTAESMTVTGLIPGTTYYFAVRAQDETPNLGGMSSGSQLSAEATDFTTSVGAGTYDDTLQAASWYFGGNWASYDGAGPLNDTVHYTSTLNDIAAFSFTSPAKFILTYSKSSNRGSFEVYVDGTFVTTINAYSATTLWEQTYASPFYSTGTHLVVIKNIGPSGKYMDVDAIQIVAPSDTTAPSTIAVTASPGTTIGSIDLHWTAPGNDGTTGIATSYLVRYSTSEILTETDWASATAITTGIPVPSAYGTPESLTVTGLTPGATYYFAVRAQDEEPNLGNISNSPSTAATAPAPVGANTYDDRDASWYYAGTWANYSGTGPYASTLRTSTVPNSLAAFSFTGPAKFTLTYSKSSTRTSFQVYVDNTLVTTINAYSATTLWKQTYTSPFYSSGTHTVVIKHTGTSGKIVDVDAIQVIEPPSPGITIYDDASVLWTYTGSWTSATVTGPYANTRHYTTTPNSTAAFSFTGPARFILTYTKNSTSGSFEVYVDDVLETTLSAYNATTLWKQTYTSQVYLSGAHKVVIKNISLSGSYVDVDAIQIISPLDATDIIAPSAITDLIATEGTDIGEVDLAWTAPGDDGTIGTATSYLVRYSTAPIDASNWASATAVTDTADVTPPEAGGGGGRNESMTVTGLIPDTTYYFAVRAQDEATNLGGMSNSSSIEAKGFTSSVAAGTYGASAPGDGIYDDAATQWYYGDTWAASTGVTGAYSTTLHTTSTLNDIAAFSFTGPAKFILSYAKGSTRGSFEIYVDGTLVTTISAYSTATTWPTYTSPCYCDATAHLVVIKNIGPSGKSVGVDAIQVVTPPVPGTTIYDDSHVLWTYTGAWTAATGLTGPSSGTLHYTTTPNDTAEFSFTGPASSFALNYSKGTNRASFQVYVDDALVTTINAYGATTSYETYTSDPVLGAGPHTVTIKHDGPNNSASGSYIDVDAIQITP